MLEHLVHNYILGSNKNVYSCRAGKFAVEWQTSPGALLRLNLESPFPFLLQCSHRVLSNFHLSLTSYYLLLLFILSLLPSIPPFPPPSPFTLEKCRHLETIRNHYEKKSNIFLKGYNMKVRKSVFSCYWAKFEFS